MSANKRRKTRFRTVCPFCGRIGTAEWRTRTFEVRCPGCGGSYDYRGQTYRPVTGGMTEEERRAHKREVQGMWYRAHAEEQMAKARDRYAAWANSATPEEREREAARVREYGHSSPERMQANRDRAAKWYRENRERRREYMREYNRNHRFEKKLSRVRRELERS